MTEDDIWRIQRKENYFMTTCRYCKNSITLKYYGRWIDDSPLFPHICVQNGPSYEHEPENDLILYGDPTEEEPKGIINIRKDKNGP
jgi:hypothetical protein